MTLNTFDTDDSDDPPAGEGEQLWYEGGTFVVPSYCGSIPKDIDVIPGERGGLGLSYFAVGADLFITGVDAGSSCQIAGVTVGSKLMSVNGISLREGKNTHNLIKREISKAKFGGKPLVLRCVPPGVSRMEVIECNGEFFSIPTYVMS